MDSWLWLSLILRSAIQEKQWTRTFWVSNFVLFFEFSIFCIQFSSVSLRVKCAFSYLLSCNFNRWCGFLKPTLSNAHTLSLTPRSPDMPLWFKQEHNLDNHRWSLRRVLGQMSSEARLQKDWLGKAEPGFYSRWCLPIHLLLPPVEGSRCKVWPCAFLYPMTSNVSNLSQWWGMFANPSQWLGCQISTPEGPISPFAAYQWYYTYK